MRQLKLICLFVLIIGMPLFLYAQETLTITTYYPSPSGSYRDLTVTNLLQVDNLAQVTNNLMAGPATAPANAWSTINVARAQAPAAGGGSPQMAIRGYHTGSVLTGGALGYTNFVDFGLGAGTQRYYGGVVGWENTPNIDDTTYAGIFFGDLMVTGRITGAVPGSSTCVNYLHAANTACPAGSYAITCGVGTCQNAGQIRYSGYCPVDGYMICAAHN